MISRTSKNPKASAKADILTELRETLKDPKHQTSKVPATPARDGTDDGGSEEGGTDEMEVGDGAQQVDPVPTGMPCPACGQTLNTVGADEHADTGDYYLQDDKAYCMSCGARVDALDEI